jgi:hypothetical protein
MFTYGTNIFMVVMEVSMMQVTITFDRYENLQCVQDVVQSDQQKSVQEILMEAGMSAGGIHRVPHKYLNMHYLCHHFVPKMLTPEH